ncbi:uncharacterized protein [Paramisgurnus dabryanus]|uniref:uncharacterized protein n=1 Tax=Paramisgurnus dabryanus TaxID=90735 RepID=UPI003CCF2D9F
MNLLMLILTAGILRMSDGFIIKGSSGPLVVPLGGSVVLPCSVDSLLPLKDLEVEWRRSDSQTLIHLYQDEDIRPEAQHQDYHDRAHFFTEDIKHGNFSLLLNNLTAEDEGQYTCKVHTGQESGETVVEIKHAERLIVSESSSISAYVGDDVTLSCSENSHIKPEEIEEVSWKKTNKGEPITVLLYQYNEILSDASDERYRDRVEFFADEIHRGNFSLRLKRVRTEDKGVYICQVFTGELSANTTVIIGQIGFSGLHIMVLILCITACGSAVIISSLIYCTSSNKILCLQVLLVFCPNTILFFAFMLWGFIEGSMHESVSCSTVYIVRPLMLFWAAPYLKDFPDIIRKWIDSSSIDVQVSIFTVLFYSIYDTWTRNQKSADADQILIAVLFVLMLLLCLIKIIKGLANMIMDKKSTNIQIRERINYVLQGWDLLSCRVLPLLQFTLLFYSFGVAKRAFFVTGVLPLIVMLSDKEWYLTCFKSFSAWLGKTLRLIIMIVMNAAIFPLVYLYFKSLENEKGMFIY